MVKWWTRRPNESPGPRRGRGWPVVLVSFALLAATGAVGVAVNRSAVRTAESVHRADSRALAANNTVLAGQLMLLSAKELYDFSLAHPLHPQSGGAGDHAALTELRTKSTFFTYAVAVTDLSGTVLASSRPASDLPAASDPGYGPLRRDLLAGKPGFSSVMTVHGVGLQAAAVPLLAHGLPAGLLIGFTTVADSPLQNYVRRLAVPGLVQAVTDSNGRIAAASDPHLIGTTVNAALLQQIRQRVTTTRTPQFIDYRVANRAMIGLVATGMSGGWAYVRLQSASSFNGPIRSRSLTINLAMLLMLLIAAAALALLSHRSQMVRWRAEERFRALVQHAPDLVAVIDRAGLIIYDSPSCSELLGLPPGSLRHMQIFDLLHPDDRRPARERLTSLIARRDGVERMEYRVGLAEGKIGWLEFTASNQLHNPALGGVVINARDISATREAHDQLSHAAHHDVLTGLPNRRYLHERLSRVLADPNATVGLLFVDLDGFKGVNDRLGHEAGDEVLRQVGARMSTCLRQGDVLARVGGDEFVMLLPGIRDRQDIDQVSARLRRLVSEPLTIQADVVQIGASVGVRLATFGELPDDVLRAADEAMYEAKKSSRRTEARQASVPARSEVDNL